MTPWCPTNRVEWYSTIILSTHVSGIASTAVSFSGMILNKRESSKIYFSASASIFLIAAVGTWPLFL